ncbi:MAG: cysteine--tRNA ligase [bacterium]|nr:MAG: cysteine--tRNA ligase [bacterium]
MALMVYDTLRAKKEEFEPIQEGKIGIYFCGMTVQDKPHIGHMLAFVAGDMIRRYLLFRGFDVTYVQNFTDVDDKIIAKANEEGVDYTVVAERNIAEYFKYADELNIMRADIYPKATEHINDIIALIERLVAKDFAYEAGGDVYFRVRKFPEYGKLSKRRIDDLLSGARIEVDEQKEDPLDFTLWKKAKEDEPAWESPWGSGRPGWHIECSVMSMKYIGETLDMHGGGQDLVFPHHENEIAQSEAATGKSFVRYWMHNGLLNLRGEKMSKSTGHFFSIEEINREFNGDVIRFYLLSTHFRSRTEFSRERLEEAKAGLERIKNICVYLDERRRALEGSGVSVSTPESEGLREMVADVHRAFLDAMDDDFNSGEAIGHIFRLVREINRVRTAGEEYLKDDLETIRAILEAIAVFDSILGLFKHGLPTAGIEVPDEVRRLVAEREEARHVRDWARSDALRDQISELGYSIEDRKDGPSVKPRR